MLHVSLCERILFHLIRATQSLWQKSSSRLVMRGSTRWIARPSSVAKCWKGAMATSLDFALIYCIPAKEWIREYNPNSFCRLICTRKTKMYLKTILRTFSCVRTLGIYPSTSIPSRLLLNVPECSAHDSVAFKPLRNMFLLFTNVCRCMISSVLYIPGPQVFQHLLLLLMLLVIPNRQISEKQRSLSRLTLN